MGKRIYSLEIFRDMLAEEGYVLLEQVYKNDKAKMRCKCPDGHDWKVSVAYWNRGIRCKHCHFDVRRNSIEKVKASFEAEGYEFLSTEYKNIYSKLEYVCPEGHVDSIRWNNWQQGHRCCECAGLKKKTIEEIKESLELDEYTLLSKEYVGNNKSNCLDYICPNGHKHTTSWFVWQGGSRCPTCVWESLSGEGSPHWKNYTDEDRKSLNGYRANVTQLSNQNFRKYYYLINPNRLKRTYEDFHLDHIFSVIDGFKRSISPKVISNPLNMRMIGRRFNQQKRGVSHITEKELYSRYIRFLTTYKNWR